MRLRIQLVCLKWDREWDYASRWLKPYIDFNTVKRQAAKNAFEKDLFKLMNNSVYGKTMENTRRHLDVRVVTSQRRAKRYNIQIVQDHQ